MSADLQKSVFRVTSADLDEHSFGTGFVIHQDSHTTYLLTCAHVVRDVGGAETVRIGPYPAEVVVPGNPEGPDDLAVLKVDASLAPPLDLQTSGAVGVDFVAVGFQPYANGNFLLRPVRGKLGEQGEFEFGGLDRIKTWDLNLDPGYELKPGQSGSPVADKNNNSILGVVSYREGGGARGLAISIETLERVWADMPAGLFREWGYLRNKIERPGFRDRIHDALHFADESAQKAAWKQLAATHDDPDQEDINEYLRSLTPDGMALIPAGAFEMGTNEGEVEEIAKRFGADLRWYKGESPRHTVFLDAFYIDLCPVTNADFKAFVDAEPQWSKDRIPSEFHDGDYLKDWNGAQYPKEKADHPVIYVSWYAAMAYCRWAGKVLPSEAQWEKAARGGLERQLFPWGNQMPDEKRANFGGNVGDTTPVRRYPPNGYGLHDMAGNVWEWCVDEWDGEYYRESPERNPVCDTEELFVNNNFVKVKNARVVRGGAWDDYPDALRVAYRYFNVHPTLTRCYVGFRSAGLL